MQYHRRARLLLVASVLGWSGPATAASVQRLTPRADTYVVAGRQASRDHGAATQLRVQGTSKVTYFSFDLSSLTGPPAHATLILSVTKSAADGGTVSRVGGTWIEGRGTERTAASDGLEFADVDVNSDGKVDAGDASPLAPASGAVVAHVGAAKRGNLVRVDVTSAFAAGPGVYTLAVSDATGSGAAFASREHHSAGRRPALDIRMDVPPPPPSDGGGGPTTGSGRPSVFAIAKSNFDRFTSNPTPDVKAWMRNHYWRLLTFAPFFDSRLAWYPRAWFYKDLYAVYPSSSEAGHPEWLLRDAAGHALFIPYGCGGGTCPQLAADPGSPAFRAQWIAAAAQTLVAGYKGLYIDDVNLFLSRVGDGNGTPVVPMDPRTGRPMTEADWRRYVAEFTEAIRAAFPSVEIVHNAIWYVGDDDPSVARQLAAANYQLLERSVNDGGIVGGSSRYGYDTFLAHLDHIHAAGGGFLLDGQGPDVAGREYSLATYFLGNAGNDGITHDHGNTPDDWWADGWEVSLGDAQGVRFASNGLWRRDFASGRVLVNPPGAPTRTVPLDGTFRTLAGASVTTARLGPAEGAVLRNP